MSTSKNDNLADTAKPGRPKPPRRAPRVKREPSPNIFTVDQLCKRWNCTRVQVVKGIREGRIAAFVLGKRNYRISLIEVERIETERLHQPATAAAAG